MWEIWEIWVWWWRERAERNAGVLICVCGGRKSRHSDMIDVMSKSNFLLSHVIPRYQPAHRNSQFTIRRSSLPAITPHSIYATMLQYEGGNDVTAQKEIMSNQRKKSAREYMKISPCILVQKQRTASRHITPPKGDINHARTPES